MCIISPFNNNHLETPILLVSFGGNLGGGWTLNLGYSRRIEPPPPPLGMDPTYLRWKLFYDQKHQRVRGPQKVASVLVVPWDPENLGKIDRLVKFHLAR